MCNQIVTYFYNIRILSIYRTFIINFTHFINKLGTILKLCCCTNLQRIICSNINVTLLRIPKKKKKLLGALLTSYKLSGTVYFPTRVRNKSATPLTIHLLVLVNLEIILYVLYPAGCRSTVHSLLE